MEKGQGGVFISLWCRPIVGGFWYRDGGRRGVVQVPTVKRLAVRGPTAFEVLVATKEERVCTYSSFHAQYLNMSVLAAHSADFEGGGLLICPVQHSRVLKQGQKPQSQ